MAMDLPVMEHFLTLQGEGFHSGRAAYFIRLGGCDVGCVWCDVKESWDVDAHPLMTVESIVGHVVESGCDYAVITGGEPCMHNLTDLTKSLNKAGIETGIETSGTSPLTGDWHWICVSPKKFKALRPEFYEFADEFKVIVYNKHDLKWAEEHAENLKGDCRLYLQPEWDKQDEMLPLIIEYIKKHPKWQLSLQTHKYLNIP